MTVLRNIPEQLILVHAPWLLGGGLIACIVACAAAGLVIVFSGETSGLFFLSLGASIPLAIFAMAIKRDQIIFDALSGTVTLQRRTLFRYGRQTHPLKTVRRVEVEDLRETQRPVLTFHTATAPYPLVEAFTSDNGPRLAAQTINTWLRAARRAQQRGA